MKELWLFTMRYPFGVRESFLENELPVLCRRFDRVVVFPQHPDGDQREMPSNAELRFSQTDAYGSATVLQMLRSAPLVIKLLSSLWKDAPSWAAFRSQWPALRSRMAQLIHRAERLRVNVMQDYDPERVIVYAYWTHDWVTVLGLVRERLTDLRFISRAHGFDLYEEQNKDGWIPFRSFQLEHVSRIYCASRTGRDHLRHVHPDRRELFVLSRLGTTDHGAGPFHPHGPLKVVSCSFLIPRKRVLRLIEALALVRRPVHWTHFGSGEEEGKVREELRDLPEHISVDLRGLTANTEVIAWYRANPVDVFVHLSHLEGGVAVAVQEATSFGIPVIAADSGGVREIVDQRTGVLLGNDPTAQEVAALLEGFRESPMATIPFREGVRAAWRAEFEANAVFDRFVDVLKGGDIKDD
ncbi:MAG: glycosyltransferase [Flavobacteriales bacterium]|nr:glycosyltransferase [Flavobacteriales bacterium]